MECLQLRKKGNLCSFVVGSRCPVRLSRISCTESRLKVSVVVDQQAVRSQSSCLGSGFRFCQEDCEAVSLLVAKSLLLRELFL